MKKNDVLTIKDVLKSKPTGYKEKLSFNADHLAIDVEIKYSRINASKILKERFEVIRKDEKGKAVKGTYVDSETGKIKPRTLVYLNEDGKKVDKSETSEYLIDKVKDTEQEVIKTRFLKFLKVVPKETMDNWAIESIYEVWGDNSGALLNIAQHLDKKSQVGVYRFSNGTIFNAFLYPLFVNGSKFILIMATARIKIVDNLRNVMEISQANKVKKLATANMVEEI